MSFQEILDSMMRGAHVEDKAKDGGFYSLKFQELGFFTLKERGVFIKVARFLQQVFKVLKRGYSDEYSKEVIVVNVILQLNITF